MVSKKLIVFLFFSIDEKNQKSRPWRILQIELFSVYLNFRLAQFDFVPVDFS